MYFRCLLPLRDYFPTVMTRYSLSVLNVLLNPIKQTNHGYWWVGAHAIREPRGVGV